MVLSREKAAAIDSMLLSGASTRTIAEAVGCSRCAVQRRRWLKNHPPDRRPAALTPEPVEPYLCQCGYLVCYRPCIICEALRGKNRSQETPSNDQARFDP